MYIPLCKTNQLNEMKIIVHRSYGRTSVHCQQKNECNHAAIYTSHFPDHIVLWNQSNSFHINTPQVENLQQK